MSSRLLRVALVIAVGSVALFVALRLLSLLDGMDDVPSVERPWWLAAGVGALAMTPVMYALLWREMLRRLDDVEATLTDVVTVFWASWLGRYVPSSLPYLAGKFVMGARLGFARRALGASLLYETALLLSVGAVSSGVVIAISLAGRGAGPLVYAGAVAGGLAGLALLSPQVIHAMVEFAARLLRREPIAREHLLSYRGIGAGAGLVSVALAFHGAGFAFLLGSFVDLSVREFVAAGAIFNLAGVVGIAVLPVPSGLGVREAVLIGLVQLFVPIEIAAAAAVLARLASVAIDVAFGVAGAAFVALRQRREEPVPERPVVARELEAA